MINILPGPDQQPLIESARNFLASELPVDRLCPGGLKMRQEPDAWDAISTMGWFNMSLPEETGGLGLRLAEEILVFREIGRYLLSPNVLATRLTTHAAHYAADSHLLSELVGGEHRASVVLARPGSRFESGWITGSFQLLDADSSRYVCIWNSEGLAVYDIDDFDVAAAVRTLDWSSTMRVATVANVAPRIWVPAKKKPLALEAVILGAAILVGNAEGTKELAVEYAKIREQFGKPIGSFQAVKHRCADMALRAETAWAQTLYATLSLAEGYAMSPYEVHGARILAADAAIKNAESSIQIHGGIGFTAEAKPHLFLKRAHTFNHVGGHIRYHQKKLIALDNLEISTK